MHKTQKKADERKKRSAVKTPKREIVGKMCLKVVLWFCGASLVCLIVSFCDLKKDHEKKRHEKTPKNTQNNSKTLTLSYNFYERDSLFLCVLLQPPVRNPMDSVLSESFDRGTRKLVSYIW